MKAENKYTLMVWAIVLLAVMNISTLVTIFYQKHQADKIELNKQSNQNLLESNTEKFSGRYFRDKLQLSDNQMDDFRNINRQFRRKASDLTDSLAILRGAMLDEMEKQNPDTAKLNTLSYKIGTLHTDLKIITYKYYLNLKSICTPQQQVRLKELFGKMFQNDSRMNFPGRGGRHGMGMGKGMGKDRNTNN